MEGRDYHLEKMLPFWSKTSDQDWHLVSGSEQQRILSWVMALTLSLLLAPVLQCEINMQGVSSSAYRPGRLSQRKEAGLDRFINWYIDAMKAGVQKDLEAQ